MFFLFLVNNNEKKILPTLKSRCLTFKINIHFCSESMHYFKSNIKKKYT